jgi:hypothetical protein
MALSGDRYPRHLRDESWQIRVGEIEDDASLAIEETVRLARLMDGSWGNMNDLGVSKSATALYPHQMLEEDKRIAAWIEEDRSCMGGISLYTQVVAVDSGGRITSVVDKPVLQVILSDLYGFVDFPEQQSHIYYGQYAMAMPEHLTDEHRMKLAIDLFETAITIQQAQEDAYYRQGHGFIAS